MSLPRKPKSRLSRRSGALDSRFRRMARVPLVGRQAGFGQAFGDSPNVLFALKRQPAHMAGEGIVRVDRLELVPNAARFIDLAHMAKGGGEAGSGGVGAGRKDESLPENERRRLDRK